jgi:hypothetical protein
MRLNAAQIEQLLDLSGVQRVFARVAHPTVDDEVFLSRGVTNFHGLLALTCANVRNLNAGNYGLLKNLFKSPNFSRSENSLPVLMRGRTGFRSFEVKTVSQGRLWCMKLTF